MLTQALAQGCARIERTLDQLLPRADQRPESIHQAMRHSVFAGGKRLRPILCMEAAKTIAGDYPKGIEILGSALELLHTYSLIHDDLPALDNDDLRRGKPTCHVAYGEATAILAGDALQTFAYEVLAGMECPPLACVRIVGEIAHATGSVDGMIGGQVADLEAETQTPTPELVHYIHRAKTGALITASLVSGGIYAGGSDPELASLRNFGEKIGLAFQIVDDVLDLTADSQQLGKTAGKDAASEKATFPALYGIGQSISQANELAAAAIASLEDFGERAAVLRALAEYLVERKK